MSLILCSQVHVSDQHHVAAAGLVLPDPGWGSDALEVPIDIAGEHLEETRRFCRAFALAKLHGRYPEDCATCSGAPCPRIDGRTLCTERPAWRWSSSES